MARCYELYRIQSVQTNPQTLQAPKEFLELIEGEEEFAEIFRKNGRDSFSPTWDLSNAFSSSGWWPWAVIAFDEEYPILGYLMSLRHSMDEMRFTAYSLPSGYASRESDTPVSIVCVRDRYIARRLANDSEMFGPAWEALKTKADDSYWLCLTESPTVEFLAELAAR